MHLYPHAPFKNGGRITTGFSTKHKAKDITPRDDDDGQVFAVGDGTVTDTESNMSHGDDHANCVIVRGSDQLLTVYAHVSPSVSAADAGGSVQDVIDAQDKAVYFEFKTLKPW